MDWYGYNGKDIEGKYWEHEVIKSLSNTSCSSSFVKV